MKDSAAESIKSTLALVGILAIIYALVIHLPPFYSSEKYESACADAFGTFSYRWVNEILYCEADPDNWVRHPDPPVASKFNIWGQELGD
ncbi:MULTISPECIES: hypothetical protein [unclassified Marinobacter]|uniref:hypothetical protein n=1 Tax=unclassified Marinobacter TaxID=83889 RepID=UPI001268AA43|nr:MULTISPECIES: hypothetical protein [unclassified Marinobacter]QFS87438.1 hypothetical protein FIV08_11420 [Marinobacter sp. THAF197a]QFT51223.1 hypothetical protein FIU96_11335 [Marinobacter sp. THAF39]